jgi:hypothetical protein
MATHAALAFAPIALILALMLGRAGRRRAPGWPGWR